MRYVGFQLISIFLLVFYSTTFKRKLFIGNLTIAILTALTLYVVAAYEPAFNIFDLDFPHVKLFWVYVIFSFFITLIREIIKDIEDVKGDSFQHCKTIPLVFGIQFAKNFVYFLLLIVSFFLVFTSIYFFSFNVILSLFLFLTVLVPLILISIKLYHAKNSKEFHQISTYIKWVTLFGIVSMIFI
ncbi:MAG: prenyltransferase [Bacteroidetes bacterium OLB11]|nr:MAG: prenyltransferase [Bacteroidetes bacterium OLB11]